MRALLLVLAACLLPALVAAAAIYLFYAEEDARGARAWHNTEAWLQSRHESLHWTDLIPPPIPDTQNLAALPLFQTEPDPENLNQRIPVLKRALSNIYSHSYSLPRASGWQLGQQTDPSAFQKNLADRYKAVFHPAPDSPPLDALAELDALCPALDEIRSAAALRSLCRLPMDYTSQPPYQRLLGPTTELLPLAQAFNLHAILALHAGRPDLALADIETMLKINSGLRQEPIIISGLVASAILAVQLDSVWEGLQLHAWNDAQLAKLQGDLSNIDFLSDEQLCLRGEALGYHDPIEDWLRDHRLAGAKVLRPRWPGTLLICLAPRGWFDLAKSITAKTLFEAAESDVDPTARRVFPERTEHLAAKVKALNPYAPWNLLPRVGLAPLIQCNLHFADAQVHADSARIACLLERYHLAHGAYPSSLDDLRINDPAGPPHDIMNGEAYHYSLQTDGAYLLYSVGWDQANKGGKLNYKPGSPQVFDREHGDWVWPTPAK